ncbi:hypothetical protein [Streptomyces sudanensis]|uniref:hypothetical protein n=1 Tax=Streptomyces sudanensis TaxID=436397 RepID=UPI0027E56202|nr:hypothetical protein [Streptomyces sudanensis]
MRASTSAKFARALAMSPLVGTTRARPGKRSSSLLLARLSAVIVVPTTGMPAAVSSRTALRTGMLLVAMPDTPRRWWGAPVMVFSWSTAVFQWALPLPVLARTRRILGVWPFCPRLAAYCCANAPWSSRRTFSGNPPLVDVSGSSRATVTYSSAASSAFCLPIASTTFFRCAWPKW